MKHYTEEDLILYYYREQDDIETIGKHLATCADCRELYSGLKRLLGEVDGKPIPERGQAYPTEVWHRLEPKLGRSRIPGWRRWFAWPRLALAASVAVLLMMAFVAGLERGRDVGFEELSSEVREKMLMVAVGEHLERSGRLLVSLVNTEPAGGLDLQLHRDQARRLASDNRVYRASAGQSGHLGMVDLLEQLERVLTEIANSPQTLSTPEYMELWRRIEGSALLVKMKLLENETRQRSRMPPRKRVSNET